MDLKYEIFKTNLGAKNCIANPTNNQFSMISNSHHIYSMVLKLLTLSGNLSLQVYVDFT